MSSVSSDRPVLIVGGGLAGLTVAHRIHREGIDFHLLEARPRLGGRILSVDGSGEISVDGFDLGPSWFWPDMQPALGQFVDDLELAFFPQRGHGDIVFHRRADEMPLRFGGMTQAPPSMRLVGGTASIISALAARLPERSIELGARATGVRLDGNEVELSFIDAGGSERTRRSSQIVFALPPRLLEETVSFAPLIDEATAQRWRDTPTWMAPHAKFFAVYERPFWREKGLSGTAQSMVGPLSEVHDATTASGNAALFGFLGLSAEQRRLMKEDEIAASCIRQLAVLFGPEASRPRATLFKDWSSDPLTATIRDRTSIDHPVVNRHPWIDAPWRGHVLLAGSETSTSEPGYLAGAIDAAESAAVSLISRMKDSLVVSSSEPSKRDSQKAAI